MSEERNMTDLDRLDALAGAATPEEIENFRRTRDWYHGGKGDGVAHGHSDCRLLAAYDAAVRERDELREALYGLDTAWAWIEQEYPKALVAMPSHLFAAFGRARATANLSRHSPWRDMTPEQWDNARAALHREAVR